MAPSLHIVELRKTGGDTLEFHKACQSVIPKILIKVLQMTDLSFLQITVL